MCYRGRLYTWHCKFLGKWHSHRYQIQLLVVMANNKNKEESCLSLAITVNFSPRINN